MLGSCVHEEGGLLLFSVYLQSCLGGFESRSLRGRGQGVFSSHKTLYRELAFVFETVGSS